MQDRIYAYFNEFSDAVIFEGLFVDRTRVLEYFMAVAPPKTTGTPGKKNTKLLSEFTPSQQ